MEFGDSASINLPSRVTSQLLGTYEGEDDNHLISSGSVVSESDVDSQSLHLQEMTNKINHSFIGYRIGESSLAKSNAGVLRAMCHSRGLSVEGYRADLAARLFEWVFRSSP